MTLYRPVFEQLKQNFDRAFAAQRQFGLVFEHNRPERLRLYGKPIMEGDVVQVLPERGKKEDSSSQLLWLVNAVRGGC